ncbi:MAG: hypothetical protein QF371_09185 [Flavobacteriales bacterium]|jgi:hypothetical protein|nr:hypothetical protein [Flavobacteriales bacterium]
MVRLVLILFLGFWLSEQVVAQSGESNPVQYCNPAGHAKCIRITAKEVFEDGANGKWSHHWKRMSYIGEACVNEHGKKKGKALEAFFAPGHYFAMFWVNLAGLTKFGFTKKEKAIGVEEPAAKNRTLKRTSDPLSLLHH